MDRVLLKTHIKAKYAWFYLDAIPRSFVKRHPSCLKKYGKKKNT